MKTLQSFEFDRYITKYSAFIIVLVILLFNAHSISFNLLFFDDYAHYDELLDNRFVPSRFYRSLVSPLFWFVLFKAALIHIAFARIIIVALFIIPCALLLYRFYTSSFSISSASAIFASTLPFILPSQTMIPTFIVGSYPAWGLLFFLLALFIGLNFLKVGGKTNLTVFLLLYLISILVLTNILLAIPLFIIYALSFPHQFKRLFLLGSVIFAVSLIEYLLMTNSIYPSVGIRHIGLEEMIKRVHLGVSWIVPFKAKAGQLLTYSLLAFFVICGLIVLKRNFKHLNVSTIKSQLSNKTPFNVDLRIFLFATSWVIVGFLPYLFSDSFSNRYLFLAGIGLCLLLAYCIELLRRLKHGTWLGFIIGFTLIVLCGFQRIISVKDSYSIMERTNDFLYEKLAYHNLPENAQLILTGGAGRLSTGGYWPWSKGAIKFASKRKDLVGLVGPEKYFYNAFGEEKRSYKFKMSGLKSDSPLFIFHYEQDSLIQKEYILTWEENEHWQLIQIDRESGIQKIVKEGNALPNLEHYLTTQKISSTSVYGYKSDAIQSKETFDHIIYRLSQTNTLDDAPIIELSNSAAASDMDPLEIKSMINQLESILEQRDQYASNSYKSNNLIINGEFETDFKSWSCWSKSSSCKMTQIKDTSINGRLSLSCNSSDEKEFILGITNLRKDTLEAGDKIFIQLVVQGQIENQTIEVFLRSQKNYKNISTPWTINLSKEPQSLNHIFDVSSNESARLDFQIQSQDKTVLLDNIIVRIFSSDTMKQVLDENLKTLIVNKFKPNGHLKSNMDSILIEKVGINSASSSVIKRNVFAF